MSIMDITHIFQHRFIQHRFEGFTPALNITSVDAILHRKHVIHDVTNPRCRILSCQIIILRSPTRFMQQFKDTFLFIHLLMLLSAPMSMMDIASIMTSVL